jgi:hypothetical protein
MIDFSRSGRMISPSKSDYRMAHPTNVVVFNANVCTRGRGKIWYGDLDLTLDATDLSRLATELNEDVLVLRERDARFGREHDPAFEQAVGRYTPDGQVIIAE